MGIVILALAICGTAFATFKSYRAWGAPAMVAVVVGCTLVLCFVPYGHLIVLLGTIGLISVAQKAIFERIALGADEVPFR